MTSIDAGEGSNNAISGWTQSRPSVASSCEFANTQECSVVLAIHNTLVIVGGTRRS